MSSDSLVDDLRAYVSALAEEVDAAVETPSAQPGPSVVRRRAVLLAVTSAVVAVLVAGFTVLTGDGGGDGALEVGPSETTVGPEPTVPPDPLPSGAEGPVASLPEVPLAQPKAVAVAWTGQELVVWGGDLQARSMGVPGEDRQFDDGAAFNPGTGRWRTMSPGPLPPNDERPVAVNTDFGVVIARGTSVALWNPADDSWTELPASPAPVHDLAWTGQQLVSASANATLRVATEDAWSALSRPPVSLERPATVWTGSELLVVGGPTSPFTQAAAIAVDPEIGQWRRLPDPPEGLRAEALSAAWDGQRVVVVNYDMQSVAYDPAGDSWDRLPPVPARFMEWFPPLEASDGYSVAFMALAVVVLTPDGLWVPLPYDQLGFEVAAMVAGEGPAGSPAVYVLGFDSARASSPLARLNLAEAVRSPEVVKVGVASVAVPDGFTITETGYDDGPAGQGVRVVMADGTDTCTVTSDYGALSRAFVDLEPVDEPIPGAPSVSWQRNAEGTTWVGDTGNFTDSLTITCDNPSLARTLVQSSRF